MGELVLSQGFSGQACLWQAIHKPSTPALLPAPIHSSTRLPTGRADTDIPQEPSSQHLLQKPLVLHTPVVPGSTINISILPFQSFSLEILLGLQSLSLSHPLSFSSPLPLTSYCFYHLWLQQQEMSNIWVPFPSPPSYLQVSDGVAPSSEVLRGSPLPRIKSQLQRVAFEAFHADDPNFPFPLIPTITTLYTFFPPSQTAQFSKPVQLRGMPVNPWPSFARVVSTRGRESLLSL